MSEITGKVAMLICDIKGYSKLSNDEKKVVYSILTKLEEEDIKKFESYKYDKNRGDGFEIITSDIFELTKFAFKLRYEFKNTNWTKKKIVRGDGLQIRIGMHYGNKEELKIAEKIEPITDLNEIFCSNAFYKNLSVQSDKMLDLKIVGINLGYRELDGSDIVENLWRLMRYSEQKKFNIKLEILGEDDVVISTYKIDKDLLFIGRGTENKIVYDKSEKNNKINLPNESDDDKTVSTIHIKIEILNDSILISDMGSLNKTYIDEERVFMKKLPLKDSNYILRLGRVKLRVKVKLG